MTGPKTFTLETGELANLGTKDVQREKVEVVLKSEYDKLTKRIARLESALEFYAKMGDDNDMTLDDLLEKAVTDRAVDKVTVNLGGKYVAVVAQEALKGGDE